MTVEGSVGHCEFCLEHSDTTIPSVSGLCSPEPLPSYFTQLDKDIADLTMFSYPGKQHVLFNFLIQFWAWKQTLCLIENQILLLHEIKYMTLGIQLINSTIICLIIIPED